MQVEQLFGKDLNELGIVHRQQKGEGAEVNVVCGINRLRGAEDGVCDGDAAAEEGRVFYVVDAWGGISIASRKVGSDNLGKEIRTVDSRYAAYPPRLL
jgi:hypothetical protein